ncbi:uncharacterized protein LOC125680383 isoform X2 [Ostrea edulis]|uniref:uncharacterized protein LOC125680383 isoform X2 n=1 Tax=Ostrea edulis TaxID=37623 RepID=UPI0020960E49|nr:uncharacterized protein LOC125680383 isoform X2 [Ostrea edulis]
MATDEEIIFEDHLYKLSGNKGKGFWPKSNPWKQKYFILKRIGDKPVLEYYSKKPKNRNSSSSKDKVVLWPSYRLEKVTNTRNRAYVFELTTQDKYLCLSADEQRPMDIFVFLLQSQMQLKKEIKDDMIIVQPENSESQRRIGAKGTNCILHIAPWGITLALQSTRSVLAQWPLKSVRYFEASGQGKFMLEAGRVAPMGDGMYVFQTQKGKDNYIYDLLDQHIVNALSKTQPGRRGTTEEMEDYIVESEKLSALTTISTLPMSQPELPMILQENWNFTVTNAGIPKPKPVVHVRQNSQMSDTGPPPLPSRFPSQSPSTNTNQQRSPAQVVNHSFQNGVSDSLVDRPPMPPPSSAHSSKRSTDRDSQTKPLTIPAGDARVSQAYFRMNSSSSGGVPNSISSQFSPVGNWTPPPTFQEATAYSPMDRTATLPSQGGYLTPRHSAEVEPTRNSGYPEQYILPTHEQDTVQFSSLPRSKNMRNSNDRQRTSKYRLRSSSCEQLDSYNLNSAVSESPRRRSVDQGGDRPYDLAKPQAPFQNLHNFRGSMEMINDDRRGSMDHYYNINGLKGTVDASPNPSVGEVRKRFNDGAREDTLTRSISNPNFMQISTKDKFTDAKAYPNKLDSKRKSKSLLNLFRKSRDVKDRRSVGSSSNPSSPVGTLTRQTSIPLISIGGKEVYFTERSRSFRKPKNKGTDSTENTPPSSRHNSYSKVSAVSNRDLPPSGSRHSSASKSPAVSKKDLPPSGNRFTKSPAANRRDLVNAVSPPLRKRERSSSYVNVAHTRSGSDISSNTGSNSIIHNRSGSDIGSSSVGSRHSTEMRRQSSSSSSKAETVC